MDNTNGECDRQDIRILPSLEDAMRSREGVTALAFAGEVNAGGCGQILRGTGVEPKSFDGNGEWVFPRMLLLAKELGKIAATLSEIALCGMKEPEDSETSDSSWADGPPGCADERVPIDVELEDASVPPLERPSVGQPFGAEVVEPQSRAISAALSFAESQEAVVVAYGQELSKIGERVVKIAIGVNQEKPGPSVVQSVGAEAVEAVELGSACTVPIDVELAAAELHAAKAALYLSQSVTLAEDILEETEDEVVQGGAVEPQPEAARDERGSD